MAPSLITAATLFAGVAAIAAHAAESDMTPVGVREWLRTSPRHAELGVETFIPADDARITYIGRTRRNADGSRTFDWEATSILLNVVNTTYVKAVISPSPGARTRFVADEPASSLSASGLSNGFVLGSFWVDAVAGAMSNDTYYAASGLDAGANYTVRLFNDLEPLFHGMDGEGYGPGNFTFRGVFLDGLAVAAPSVPSRRIEWVGDSLTAGFGSRGVSPPCQTNSFSSSNYFSYTRYICDGLQAACTCIAWSGKGMWKNCCDDGETMPSYFRQTLGGDSYTSDWDFSNFVPSALAINLGTFLPALFRSAVHLAIPATMPPRAGSNDMSKYNGTAAWIAELVAVYTTFVQAATSQYYKAPSTPVLVVQGPSNNTVLFGALQTAVADLRTAGVDAHYVSAIVTTGEPDGCQGHPGTLWHKAMAEVAAPQIQAILGW